MVKLRHLGAALAATGLAIGATIPVASTTAWGSPATASISMISGSCTAATVTYTWSGFKAKTGDSYSAIVGFKTTGADDETVFPWQNPAGGSETVTDNLSTVSASATWTGVGMLRDETTQKVVSHSRRTSSYTVSCP